MEGTLRSTGGLDTVNHVVGDDEDAGDAIEVPVRTLDAALGDVRPMLIKVDVKGFETEVMAGAERALASPDLLAVIMELNGSGKGRPSPIIFEERLEVSRVTIEIACAR